MDRANSPVVSPLRVLSLDGGGIRGISSLLILEDIMQKIREARGLDHVPRPCEHFDLIGGTSTRGIIAIMLGRLGMTMDECIRAYRKVAQQAFTPKRTSILPAPPTGAFSVQALETAIKQTIREFCIELECVTRRSQGCSTADACPHSEMVFRDRSCTKTVILAITKDNIDAPPTLFKTYDTSDSFEGCTIWQVARATSAATTLFKSIKVGRDGIEFVDAGFGYNNPCEVLIEEAQRQYPRRQRMRILSIGTGLGDVVTIKDTRFSIISALKKMAMTSKRVAATLDRRYGDDGQYYRFSVSRGLDDITISDWESASRISAHTRNYLTENERAIRKFVDSFLGTAKGGEAHNMEISRIEHEEQQKRQTQNREHTSYYIPMPKNKRFVGRQSTLNTLKHLLFMQKEQNVALVGLGGIGKTQVALQLSYWTKEMDPQEATSFLRKSLVQKDLLHDDTTVTELLDELTHLPLAITQAAAYLNTNQVSIAEYLELLRGTEQDMIGLMNRAFHDSTGYRGSQNAVGTTWLVSFDQIRKSDPTAADLLSFLSCIEPRAIPRSILPSLQSKEQMIHAIGTLSAYSFITRRGESKIFDMHSLVHLATRIWVRKYGIAKKATESTIRSLAKTFPSDDYINRNLWREYMPHALKALQKSEGLDMEDSSILYMLVGQCLYADGRITEAVSCLETSYKWQKDHFPENNASRLELEDDLACTYLADGQMKKAFDLLEHAVAVREKTFPEDHPNRLASQHGLAQAYLADGQVKKAVDLLEHVVAVREKTLAEDHSHRLASQHGLARAYQADGQVNKAVNVLEHVVAVAEKTFAEDHQHRLASQHQLAAAYLADGQIKKAVDLLEHVVAVAEKTVPESHLDRLTSQYELAKAYQADGRVKKAVDLLEYVAAVQEKTLTEDHLYRLASQHQLATAYLADGQVKKAVDLLEHVVAVREKTLTEDHPRRLASQHVLAKAYQADGRVKKAVELLEHVVAVREKTLTEDHPRRLASEYGLAKAYLADGQVKRAVDMLEHVVAVREKTLAEDHPDRLASQHELARAYQANEQVKQAADLLE